MNVHGVPGPLAKRNVSLVSRLVVLGIVQAASLVGLALVIQSVTSSVVGGVATRVDVVQLSLLVLLCLAGPVARWVERVDAERLGNRYVHQVRLVLFDALTRGGQRRGRPVRQRGVQMVRFSNDLTALRQWVSLGFSRLIGTLLFLSGV